MARFVLFLLLLVPVAMAGNWLLDHQGLVDIQWDSYRIHMNTAMLGLMIGLACVLVSLTVLLLWQLATWPERRRARRRFRTQSRGLRDLTRGVTLLALGNEAAAQAALKKAMVALPNEPLPQLLTAQMLQRQGNYDAARVHLRALLKHETTALLASRRLIEQHLERQEWAAAVALAEQVRDESPNDRWLVITLLDLYARAGNTKAMLGLTEGFQWQSPLEKPERNHYAGIAYFLQAPKATSERLQRHDLRHAIGFAPEFLPATLAYAEFLIAQGDYRAARKQLLTAWLSHPRPLLIAPILHAIEHESPRTQERLLRPFLKIGDSAAHDLLRARHALAMGNPHEAETSLELALGKEETAETCRLMAEAVKQLRGEEAANRWLLRAMQAPEDASFICQQCGTAHAHWLAHCEGCGAFDSLHYERPADRITSVELTAPGL